jgi:hypothetical protein
MVDRAGRPRRAMPRTTGSVFSESTENAPHYLAAGLGLAGNRFAPGFHRVG